MMEWEAIEDSKPDGKGFHTVRCKSINEVKEMKNKTCIWELEIFGEYWETSCGRSFCLTHGNPAENDYIHCPGCGNKIKEK